MVLEQRHLLLWQNVRIHLDEVEQLGTFIELEAVAPPGSDLANEHRLVAELRDALGDHGYAPGSSVLVEELPGGDLRIMSTERVRERTRSIGERLVAEHGEALQILADHDPEAPRH